MAKAILSQERLKEVLDYNPDTGVFRWKQNGSVSIKPGDVAGSPDKDGYILIGIDYAKYKAHRLAFYYMTGSFPFEVDHINRIKNDNRWENLKPSTKTENQRNRNMNKNNTSGINGVSWCKQTQSWKVYITLGSQQKHLGRFKTLFDAACARKSAEAKYGFKS